MTIEHSAAKTRIDWLDYARLISALMVVFYHYLKVGPNTGQIQGFIPSDAVQAVASYGYLGVDFFFMVSGYVIMMSVAGRSASQFAAARIVRLYPAFVCCMTLTAITIIALPTSGFDTSVVKYVGNLTMVPSALGIDAMDGVYWTLAFEIFFYAAVFLVILLGQSKRMEGIVLGWLALQLAATFAGANLPFFGGSFVLFSAGCMLYFGTMQGWTTVRVVALLASIGLNSVWVVWRGAEVAQQSGLQTSPVALVCLILFFFVCFISLSRSGFQLWNARVIGSLTYPLYLLHAYIGYILISKLTPVIDAWASVAVVTVLMIGLSWLVAHFVELKMRNHWKRLANFAVLPIRMFEGLIANLVRKLTAGSGVS